ncbi:MAG: hypothetical protein HY666_03095 [Chloroflexi bacterium]|nr:hypothetical protein [Chloroflexota bacterium]
MPEKYLREIEEILKQAGGQGGKRRPKKPRANLFGFLGAQLGKSLGGKKLSFSPARLLLVSVVVLLSALVLRAMSPGLVAPLVWVGLILFIIAYALFFVSAGTPYEKRWRGRLIERPSPLWQKLRRLLKL